MAPFARNEQRERIKAARKEKLAAEISRIENLIELCKNRAIELEKYKDIESSSDEEFTYSLPDKSTEDMKIKESQNLDTYITATMELTDLEIKSCDVKILREAPEFNPREKPVSQEGNWHEVEAECHVSCVPFSIKFFRHQPLDAKKSESYRGLSVTLSRGAYEKELAGSILERVATPSLVATVLNEYASAFMSRRSTLQKILDKFGRVLNIESCEDGGCSITCQDVIEVKWRLENQNSPYGPFRHRMAFDIEHIDREYLKIVKEANKEISKPISTERRTELLSKIIYTCIKARGLVDEFCKLESESVDGSDKENSRFIENEAIEDIHDNDRIDDDVSNDRPENYNDENDVSRDQSNDDDKANCDSKNDNDNHENSNALVEKTNSAMRSSKDEDIFDIAATSLKRPRDDAEVVVKKAKTAQTFEDHLSSINSVVTENNSKTSISKNVMRDSTIDKEKVNKSGTKQNPVSNKKVSVNSDRGVLNLKFINTNKKGGMQNITDKNKDKAAKIPLKTMNIIKANQKPTVLKRQSKLNPNSSRNSVNRTQNRTSHNKIDNAVVSSKKYSTNVNTKQVFVKKTNILKSSPNLRKISKTDTVKIKKDIQPTVFNHNSRLNNKLQNNAKMISNNANKKTTNDKPGDEKTKNIKDKNEDKRAKEIKKPSIFSKNANKIVANKNFGFGKIKSQIYKNQERPKIFQSTPKSNTDLKKITSVRNSINKKSTKIPVKKFY